MLMGPDHAHVVATARPGLDLRSREVATIAALTALGTAPARLRSTLWPG